MNIRLKFSRLGPVKYLGHLDMMRYFQKVLLRANVDMKYSEGFNPHQIMSFAYPLGVSMESLGDYLDIEVNSFENLDDLILSMNKVMHEGVSIVSASIVPEDELNAMASVAAAKYRIFLNKDVSTDLLKDFLNQNQILIQKETKKGIVNKDIKEGIFEVTAINHNELELFLKSGSSLNVKPADLIVALSEFSENNFKIIHNIRLDIFRLNKENCYCPLGEF